MKKLLAVAALTIASTSAFAGIELKYRGDYANTPKYDGRSGTEVNSRSEFLPNYFRVNGTGKVGDADVKLSLNLSGNNSATGDLSSEQFVQQVYISKPLVDGLSVQFGKIETFLGGIEAYNNEAGGTWMNTLANGGNAGNYLFGATVGRVGTANSGNLTMANLFGTTNHNARGFSLNYNYGMGAVSAFLTNDANNIPRVASDADTQVTGQKKHDMGLQWAGSFLDGSLKPAVGYAIGYADGDTGSVSGGAAWSGRIEYINAGIDWVMNDLGLTLEYLQNTGRQEAFGSTGTEEDKITTWYVNATYKLGDWKPFAKVEMSQFKDQDAVGTAVDATSFDRTAFQIGTEWTPKAGEPLSFHVAYFNAADKYKANPTAGQNDNVKFQQWLGGMKYTADFLK